jgi:hypothetical protein
MRTLTKAGCTLLSFSLEWARDYAFLLGVAGHDSAAQWRGLRTDGGSPFGTAPPLGRLA